MKLNLSRYLHRKLEIENEDLVFINDLFPKDWVVFLSGQPLQYLKVGSDAINLNFHPGRFSAQLLITPTFEPDNLPTGQRLFFFKPPLIGQRTPIKPKLQFGNFEVAGRLYKTILQFDLSLYGYRGFSPSPAFLKNPERRITKDPPHVFTYPKLRVYGASAQGSWLSGIISLEGGYYDAIDDRDGDAPHVDNPEIRYLAGYQRALSADLTVGLQYYGEVMLKYDEYKASLPDVGLPQANQIRHNITLRATQFLRL